jgi:anti-sigma B factor antagonist
MAADERQDGADRLAISATRLPGEAVVVRLEGELDVATCPWVYGELDAWRGEEPELRLDLSGITFIDSQGLHLLMAVTGAPPGGGRPVALLSPSERVLHVVRVTGIGRRLGLEA